MYITKAKIKNFKSIQEIEIPFDKVGNSFTKILVGINESGKSNILEALSYFEVPQANVDFYHFCNQKMEEEQYCDLYFTLDFDEGEKEELHKIIQELITSDSKISYSITNICKNVYLENGATKFTYTYEFDIIGPIKDLYFKKTRIANKDKLIINDLSGKNDGMEILSKEQIEDFLKVPIEVFVKEHEPKVSMWKPTPEYLLADADLNSLKNNFQSNKPLYNIFKLSGFETQETIAKEIGNISNSRNRSRLVSKLNSSINNYISKIWGNSIDLIIEITENGKFSLLIKDKGQDNQHDRFSITERSQGAQQFLSLILSLSLETENEERHNELILIDEPEVHLHPSGIRDIARELLKIGERNHVFLSTHSPFMIDKNGRERHYIIKKDKKAITKITRIKDSDNIIDDEVLREAFGIDVYRDLLNPHSILVEGASDKIILNKAFNCLNYKNISITNGHGSNIVTLASKLNYDNMSLIVVLDDDDEGKSDKNKIIKIGDFYNDNNVFTIRELVGELPDKATIEDTLNVEFVKSAFKKYYEESFGESPEFDPDSTQPILNQIIIFLKKNKKFNKWDMDAFKKRLSEDFNPNKESLTNKNQLLKNLAEKLHSILTK